VDIFQRFFAPVDLPTGEVGIEVPLPDLSGGGDTFNTGVLTFDPNLGDFTGGSPEIAAFISVNTSGIEASDGIDEDIFARVSILQNVSADRIGDIVLGNEDAFGSLSDPEAVAAIGASPTAATLAQSDQFLNAVASDPAALALWIQQPAFAESLANNPIAQQTIAQSAPSSNNPQIFTDANGFSSINNGGNAVSIEHLRIVPGLETHSPITPTTMNSAAPNQVLNENTLSGQNLQGLEGLIINPVSSFEVIPPATGRAEDVAMQREIEPGSSLLVTNSTFNSNTNGVIGAGGSVLTNGSTPDEEFVGGDPKTARRGGVALLEDGTFIVGNQFGTDLNSIQQTFGQPDNAVREFVGGGGLIIRNGIVVPQAEFNTGIGAGGQHFDQPRPDPETGTDLRGADGAQLGGDAPRTLIGIRDGQAYVITTESVNLFTDNTAGNNNIGVQEQLLNAGFTEVVVFDGGAQNFLFDPSTIGQPRADGTPSDGVVSDGRPGVDGRNEDARGALIFRSTPELGTPGEMNTPGQPMQ